MPVKTIALLSAALLLLFAAATPAYAHLQHLSTYNSRGESAGSYYVYEALDPGYAAPGEQAAIMFSVQDYDGRDTNNIETMIEIYASSGERLKAFPWTKQDIGDFQVYYTFQEAGTYQIVLSIANGPVNTNEIDPPRGTLGSTANCNCERVIFNAAISQSFGMIYNSTLAIAVFAPLGIFGAVLGLTYWNRKKSGKFVSAPGDTVKYIVMLAAIAGGMVHFAVYSGHASLRLEYSIFLIVAGGMQVTYGTLYTVLTLAASTPDRARPQDHYRKTLAVNLFGLVGTAILLGLYGYSVILPPPLSPTSQPDPVDSGGILAISVETFMVIGIVYLMRLEKRRLRTYLKEHA